MGNSEHGEQKSESPSETATVNTRAYPRPFLRGFQRHGLKTHDTAEAHRRAHSARPPGTYHKSVSSHRQILSKGCVYFNDGVGIWDPDAPQGPALYGMQTSLPEFLSYFFRTGSYKFNHWDKYSKSF